MNYEIKKLVVVLQVIFTNGYEILIPCYSSFSIIILDSFIISPLHFFLQLLHPFFQPFY